MKAGVIGLGVGEQHIIGYRRAGIEVAAVCDLDRTRAKSVAGKYGVPVVADSFADLLDECDIVSIASYDNHHGEQVVAALLAGKHVFCEKPLCLSWAELRAIRAALRDDTVLTMNLPLRAHWRSVMEDDHGRVISTAGRYKWGRNRKFAGWRGKMGGYSLTLGGGIHLLDIQLALHEKQPKAILACPGLDGLLVASTLIMTDSFATLVSDFSYDGPHGHELIVVGTEKVSMILNHDSVDKTALIPGFVEACRGDRGVEPATDHIFRVMEICLSIEDILAVSEQSTDARIVQ